MRKRDLTQGSISGNLISFSLPYMLAYFLQLLYGLADLFVIGRYCGVESTTAVSNGAQIMYMITVMVIGLAMGATVRIGTAFGAKDKALLAKLTGNTISFFLLLSLLLSVSLLLLHRPIVQLIDTPPEAIEETANYLIVCFAGIPFIVAYNVAASIFRGSGDSKSPMFFVAAACAINVVLDFLFIGQFRMGATGAALATTLSQMTSAVIAFCVIRRQKDVFELKRSDFRLRRRKVGSICKVGIPIALQDGFIQVSFIAITIIANGRGLNDAAAVGIVEKFIGLLFIIPSSMLGAVSTITAQNVGAGSCWRAVKTLKASIGITTAFGLVSAVSLQFCAELPIHLFTADVHVIRLGGEYLQSYVWDCIPAGVHFCFSGFFTAIGYSGISFAHNAISIITSRIPLALLASKKFPQTLYPMGFAAPIGSMVSAAICLAAYLFLKRQGKLFTVQCTVSADSKQDYEK